MFESPKTGFEVSSSHKLAAASKEAPGAREAAAFFQNDGVLEETVLEEVNFEEERSKSMALPWAGVGTRRPLTLPLFGLELEFDFAENVPELRFSRSVVVDELNPVSLKALLPWLVRARFMLSSSRVNFISLQRRNNDRAREGKAREESVREGPFAADADEGLTHPNKILPKPTFPEGSSPEWQSASEFPQPFLPEAEPFLPSRPYCLGSLL